MELNEKDLNQISGGAVSSDGTKCEVKDGSIVKECSNPNHQKVGVLYRKCGDIEFPSEYRWGYQDYICLNCGAKWTKEISLSRGDVYYGFPFNRRFSDRRG